MIQLSATLQREGAALVEVQSKHNQDPVTIRSRRAYLEMFNEAA